MPWWSTDSSSPACLKRFNTPKKMLSFMQTLRDHVGALPALEKLAAATAAEEDDG